MKQKSPVSFVSASALLHGSILLAFMIVPALKMLPEVKNEAQVELVSDASMAPSNTAEEKEKTPAQPAPISTALPEPKKIEKTKTSAVKKPSPAQNVVETELPKKIQKKVVMIDATEKDIVDSTAQAAAAEAIAKQEELIPVQEQPPAQAVDETSEDVEPLPPPQTQPVVQKLSEVNEAPVESEAASGPSTDELRSYLELKQISGNKAPQYPSVARRNGYQGQVTLKYYVTEQGSVKDLEIAKSSGHLELDKEALRAVSQYRYVPGQEGWTQHPVVFSLKGQASPDASRLRTAGQTQNQKSE